MDYLPAEREATPLARMLVRGEEWCVGDYVCHAGPQDRPFEERHETVTIAAVLAGRFCYRSDSGRALLYPGAFLLGNAGSCFECGHEHGTGDRCIAFHFAPDFFAEIAAAATGSSRFRFAAAMLPATRALTRPAAEIEALAQGPAAAEDAAVRLAESVLAATAGGAASAAAPSPREARRIAAALRRIEEHAEEPLALADLAAAAGMSKYHFLRCFRRIAGVTPYELLLATRLRRAALRLGATHLPVTTIAFEAGFGDLSTFNARFRRLFGVPPGAWRARRLS